MKHAWDASRLPSAPDTRVWLTYIRVWTRQEPDIPLLTQVIKVCGLDCTLQHLNKAEMMVLKAHSWNVCVVTPIHFVDMYVLYSTPRACETSNRSSHQRRPFGGLVVCVIALYTWLTAAA